MNPGPRKKGQALIVLGMAACAASVIVHRFDLDFISGVFLGASLALFFFGFRAFYGR